MTVKMKPLAPAAPHHTSGTHPVILQASPSTAQEQRPRIEALGNRIAEYVRLFCEPVDLQGTSAEARERAVAAFYEEIVSAELRLARIYNEHLLE